MRSVLLAFGLLTALSCGGEEEEPSTLRSGIDPEALDRSVAPCDDFYQFSCGRWIREHPLPADAGRVQRFSDPFYDAVPNLRTIVDALSRGSEDAEERIVAQYRDACLAAPDNVGARVELATEVRAIGELRTLEDLGRQAAAQRFLGSASFFHTGIEIDPGDSSRAIVYLDPGGYELYDRSYYLDAEQEAIRSQYRAHITALSGLILGVPLDHEAVMKIETALAQATPPPREYDPVAFYHRMTHAQLEALAPSFPWAAFWEALGIATPEVIDVTVPEYLVAIEAVLSSARFEELLTYLQWQLLQDRADSLDQEVTDRDFEFWNAFTGREEPLDRDWLCFLDTLGLFEPIIAQRYVERFFDEDSLAAGEALSSEVVTAFGARLVESDWLDDTTRAEALAKLEQILLQIGHPDAWEAYGDLDLEGATFFEMGNRLFRRGLAHQHARLGKPVDRYEWPQTTIQLNAFFSFQANSVIVGGLMLAPPFVDPGASKASQLGGLGAVVGHELTHGFDDSGRLFDRTGTLRDWWTQETEARFVERSECLVQQFDAYEPLAGMHVDGLLTLGENIADLGGMSIAHRALIDGGEGAGEPIAGYDPEQLFFIAYAQVWCENARPELLASGLVGDAHSPGRYRVNGVVTNMPEFAEAFDCPADAPMRRADPCQVW